MSDEPDRRDARVTNPAELEPRQANQLMMSRIRAAPLVPYQEGGYVLRVAAAPGRVTGKLRPWPIAVSQLAGQRYVCAPNRRRDWVRNLLAAGECRIEGDPVDRYRAVLVEEPVGATVVANYLAALGRNTQHWPFPSGAAEDEIARYLTEIAVFRLNPCVPTGP
jgi:hypothetical protein